MVKNIIFDLGGVILDVDYNNTVAAFAKLGIIGFESIYAQQKQAALFDRFEKGLMPAVAFRDEIKKMKPGLTDALIDQAWNAMIISTPPERMKFLENLKPDFNLFLLSNTNEIHILHFTDYFDQAFGKNYFNSLFKKIYLSSQLGMRKPEPEIFNYVIEQNELQKKGTLFIDDSVQHVAAAQQAGMHALLLPKHDKIESFLFPAMKMMSLC